MPTMERARPHRDDRTSVSVDMLIGAIAGFTATVPMTLIAASLFERLPRRDRYPLPPRELTESAMATAGMPRPEEQTLRALTLVSHFGFGAAAGALYGLLRRWPPAHPPVVGVPYALAVWTASYMGWVPSLRLLRPATEHPTSRNGLMIAAHVIWGAALGSVAHGLRRSLAPISSGPIADRPTAPKPVPHRDGRSSIAARRRSRPRART